MKKFILAAAVLALISSSAQANVWDFSFASVAGDTATGQFITGPTGSPYAISSITGVFDHLAIIGISSYAGADNQLFVPGPDYASYAGISFTSANGFSYNLTNLGDPLEDIINNSNDPVGYGIYPVALTSFNVSAVPEPAIWAMFVFGFGTIGWQLRSGRRRQGASAVV